MMFPIRSDVVWPLQVRDSHYTNAYTLSILPLVRQKQDGLTTVIFNADAIKAYFDANPKKLPEVVPPCNRPCDCKRK